jgi:spore coat protein CotH
VNSPTEAVSADDLEKVLDVDEILRFLAVSVALVHLDNYIGAGHNYYLYENEGVFEIIPWDLNMCFAGFTSDLNDDALLGFFIDEPTAGPLAEYPLVAQLLAKPEFMDIYHAYLQQLIDGPFSVQRMSARIREIATLILPAVAQTQGTDLTLDHFERGLNRFVEARTESIAAQLSGRSPASSGDGSGNGGSVGIGGAGRNPGEVPGQSDSQSPGQRLIPTRATTVTTLGN